MKDLYHILAADVNCNQLEIQQAYDKLQSEFATPSTQSRQVKYRYKEICRAYRVLSDPIKRHKYDQQFQAFLQPKQNYTKAIDITFTIILVFFTCVFGDYVITSFHNHKLNHSIKTAKLQKAAVNFKARHTSKKHFSSKLKLVNSAEVSSQPINNKVNQLPVQQIIAKINTDAEQASLPEKVVESENPVGKQSIPTEPDFLYETNLKANETGKINLRQTDSYNAAIIEVLPGGAKVAVLEKGSIYYKVRFENSVGFVPKWTLAQK